MEELLLKILERIQEEQFSFFCFEDLYHMGLESMKTDCKLGVKYLKLLSDACEKAMQKQHLQGNEIKELFALHKKVLLAAAPYDFESFCYMLNGTESRKKFYPPRRNVLRIE